MFEKIPYLTLEDEPIFYLTLKILSFLYDTKSNFNLVNSSEQ
uniref:Uncharacterized protein n=1 Tax=Arundo donax TaxID=35708 RepID=A0A0A9F6D1_ARUDO